MATGCNRENGRTGRPELRARRAHLHVFRRNRAPIRYTGNGVRERVCRLRTGCQHLAGPVRSALAVPALLRGRARTGQGDPRPVLIIACMPFAAVLGLGALGFAPYAVWTRRRDGWSTAAVALWVSCW